jgi:hypothetical protein
MVKLPTAVLWEMREFKRDEVPAPKNSFVRVHTVEEVTNYVHATGKLEPVELSIIGDRALLTDGNHRIVAAERLGLRMIPVHLVVYFGEHSHPFYEHTLQKFEPISRHLELWLKKIFLSDTKGLTAEEHSQLIKSLNLNERADLN